MRENDTRIRARGILIDGRFLIRTPSRPAFRTRCFPNGKGAYYVRDVY